MSRVCAVLLCCALGAVLGAVEPRAVPAEVAAALQAAERAGDPAAALAALDAYRGRPHPLIALARGTALRQNRDAVRAEEAYRAALAAGPTLREAGLGLAQLTADRGDWAQAVRLLGEHLDLRVALPAQLLFYADAALRAGDRRLAAVLTHEGMLRFPGEAGFRRLDIALLAAAGRHEELRAATIAELDRAPADAALWRRLAWAAQGAGHADEALIALEAAWLAAPEDVDARRRLAEAQLARGQPRAALDHLRVLVDAQPRPADPALLALAARAAAAAEDPAAAKAWLDAVPRDRRGRDVELLAARVALRADDLDAAWTALDALVAAGERDSAVLTWAGHVADRRGDAARAEALWRQAIAAAGEDPAAASAAVLRLAALLARTDRVREAREALETYLARRGDDEHARALLARLPAR